MLRIIGRAASWSWRHQGVGADVGGRVFDVRAGIGHAARQGWSEVLDGVGRPVLQVRQWPHDKAASRKNAASPMM